MSKSLWGGGRSCETYRQQLTARRYPVIPEVGKIGQSKHAYILPVAERRDGIKSFFAKQVSPAKPKAEPAPKAAVKAEPVTPTKPKPASQDSKPDTKPASQEVTEVPDSDGEKAGKRKAERQGGRRTKVVRAAPEAKRDQKSITSFFKSPKK